jgi:hypothetical protein
MITEWVKIFEGEPTDYQYLEGAPGDPAVSGNVNVTAVGWCYGQIKGDPDIAGNGVSGQCVS